MDVCEFQMLIKNMEEQNLNNFFQLLIDNKDEILWFINEYGVIKGIIGSRKKAIELSMTPHRFDVIGCGSHIMTRPLFTIKTDLPFFYHKLYNEVLDMAKMSFVTEGMKKIVNF